MLRFYRSLVTDSESKANYHKHYLTKVIQGRSIYTLLEVIGETLRAECTVLQQG